MNNLLEFPIQLEELEFRYESDERIEPKTVEIRGRFTELSVYLEYVKSNEQENQQLKQKVEKINFELDVFGGDLLLGGHRAILERFIKMRKALAEITGVMK